MVQVWYCLKLFMFLMLVGIAWCCCILWVIAVVSKWIFPKYLFVLFWLLLLNWFFVCFFVCFLLWRIQNQNYDTISFWGLAALDICDGCILLFECVKKLFLVPYYWVGSGLKSLWLLWLNEFVLGRRIFLTSWYCYVIECVYNLYGLSSTCRLSLV